MNKPVALIILDGFGLAEPGPGNAVAQAATPFFDKYWHEEPHAQLEASGLAVGLPEGQIGNSEVGHMNLGAGRVVLQSLTFIDEQVRSGEFFSNPVLNEAFAAAKGQTVHLLGLVSHGGVHSDIAHLLALLQLSARHPDTAVAIHAFTDGRDSPPDSGLGCIEEVEAALAIASPDARIASVTGRYFAMDRDHRWERTRRAYDAIVCGQAPFTAATGSAAVRAAYARDETDEFIQPTVITWPDGTPVATVQDGDSVIFFNFRADRARQLSHALLGGSDWQQFQRCRVPGIHFVSFMEYSPQIHAPHAFERPPLTEPLAEVLAVAGLTQYHTAETEKYAHVTWFFNGLREEPFPGEDRFLVPSAKVATYDLLPAMSSLALTEATLARLRNHDDDFILVNYANPDMVGHSGVLEATIAACEASDLGLGALVEAVVAKGGVALILADHGNAEQMLEADGVSPHTAHTANPVPFVIVGAGPLELRPGGRLADVAPTILELLDVTQPAVMTGRSLIVQRGHLP
jgi:2,3-bisphosphoglycerate-independent phosphoglycerate mutase